MKIRYLGHSCFEITSSKGVKIITDPYQGVGYELPLGLSADFVTVSHGHFDHSATDRIEANKVISALDGYEGEGIKIEGISSYHDEKQGALRGKNVVFKITVDGITLCHMGDIGERCNEGFIEKIGKVDVLLIPVGGTYTVDGEGAMEYAARMAPKTLIPMHYRPTDGSLDIVDIQPFLSLSKEEVREIDGEMELDANTQGIFYMKRVK